MSERLADQADELAYQTREAKELTDNENQHLRLDKVAEKLEKIARIDREQHGATPTDKLRVVVEKTDKCLACGEPLDEGGWCGIQCLQDYKIGEA